MEKLPPYSSSTQDPEGRLLDTEAKLLKSIASKVKLGTDTRMVKFLYSLDKSTRNLLFARLIAEIDSSVKDNRAKYFLPILFSFLNRDIFADRIKTPEDILHYATKIIKLGVSNSNVSYDEFDFWDEHWEHYGKSDELVKKSMSLILDLIREDFDQELDIGIMYFSSLRGDYKGRTNILKQILFKDIAKNLIKNGEDFRRFFKFLENIEKFRGIAGITEKDSCQYIEKIFGDNWKTIAPDSKKLDEILSALEELFRFPQLWKYIDVFLQHYQATPIEDRVKLLNLVKNFAIKNITPEFVVGSLPLLQNCDFSKDGLDLFPSFELKEKWLNYCTNILDTQNVSFLARFFNDAIKPNEEQSYLDLTLSKDRLRLYSLERLKIIIDKSFDSRNLSLVSDIRDSIIDISDLVSESETEFITKVSALDESELLRYLECFIDSKFTTVFQALFEKIKNRVFSELPSNKKLATSFLLSLEDFCNEPWIVPFVLEAVTHYELAFDFYQKYLDGSEEFNWKETNWAEQIFDHIKSTYRPRIQNDWAKEKQNDVIKFKKNQHGFRETDPYRGHSYLFTTNQAHIASAFAELMTGKANTIKLGEMGINVEEIKPLLVKANRKIKAAFRDFQNKIQSESRIDEEDKKSLISPELSFVRMTPLLDNVRAYVARYLVQRGGVDPAELKTLIDDLDRVLNSGFNRYLDAHVVDIPYYDKLFEEFDEMRKKGRYPLEVYLGRDGIYAWISRRSQDISRRRRMGLEGRKQQRETGEAFEIKPKYLVYPRYFSDSVRKDVLKEFLAQEGVSAEVDPFFYDTGFSGSIPEQILEYIGMREESEKRIRLLSAQTVHRRIRGISENARDEIVEKIEHNAKTEDTAEGLIKDKETGKIRHIAMPTDPEDQFYFLMIKQALERHYWLKESLNSS